MNKIKKVIYNILFLEKKYINFFGIPLHKNEDYLPFFIVGSGRSGNTLLRRILNNHSELYIPPETYVLGSSIQDSFLYPQLGWANTVSLIYSNFEYNEEFETFNIKSLKHLYASVSKVPKDMRSIAYILNSFYEEYRKHNNIKSKRWGDKTPLNTFAMHELYSVFPKSKFIHIIRDPYDSIASYVKSGIYDNLEDATYRWKISLELAFEFEKKYPLAYTEIYYEDMVSNTEFEIKKLCDFLNIEFEDTMLSMKNIDSLGDVGMREHHKKVMKPIDKTSIGKGKRTLNRKEIKIINGIIDLSKSEKLIDYFNRIKI